MDWTRITRLWAWPGRDRSARARWEYIGRSASDAAFMMDGSRSEAQLRENGARMAGIFRQALAVEPGHRVLEVGCGVGRVGRELAPLCGPWTGADISRSLLRRARARMAHLPRVRLHHLTGDHLDGLGDAAFDRLICHLVLLHVAGPQVRRLLSEFARVLAPDGLAYLDLWNRDHPEAAALARREAADRRLGRQPHRSRFYSETQLRSWLAEAGLVPAWLSAHGFLLQAVALPAGADPALQAAAAGRAAATPDLVPGGRLVFDGPSPA